MMCSRGRTLTEAHLVRKNVRVSKCLERPLQIEPLLSLRNPVRKEMMTIFVANPDYDFCYFMIVDLQLHKLYHIAAKNASEK